MRNFVTITICKGIAIILMVVGHTDCPIILVLKVWDCVGYYIIDRRVPPTIIDI